MHVHAFLCICKYSIQHKLIHFIVFSYGYAIMNYVCMHIYIYTIVYIGIVFITNQCICNIYMHACVNSQHSYIVYKCMHAIIVYDSQLQQYCFFIHTRSYSCYSCLQINIDCFAFTNIQQFFFLIGAVSIIGSMRCYAYLPNEHFSVGLFICAKVALNTFAKFR